MYNLESKRIPLDCGIVALSEKSKKSWVSMNFFKVTLKIWPINTQNFQNNFCSARFLTKKRLKDANEKVLHCCPHFISSGSSQSKISIPFSIDIIIDWLIQLMINWYLRIFLKLYRFVSTFINCYQFPFFRKRCIPFAKESYHYH